MHRRDISDYLTMGAVIGLCAAAGILLGVFLSNLLLWLLIGAGIGAVIGAIAGLFRK